MGWKKRIKEQTAQRGTRFPPMVGLWGGGGFIAMKSG